jgi:hypothetical protein
MWRFWLFAIVLNLAACGSRKPADPDVRKPWAIGQEWEGIARLCMSDRPNRLDGCKALWKQYTSKIAGDCVTFAFYELRAPKHKIDKEDASEGKIGCQTDLGILPYDGKEVLRLTKRTEYLEAEIRDMTSDRKDAIDDIEIERLRDEMMKAQSDIARIKGGK